MVPIKLAYIYRSLAVEDSSIEMNILGTVSKYFITFVCNILKNSDIYQMQNPVIRQHKPAEAMNYFALTYVKVVQYG